MLCFSSLHHQPLELFDHHGLVISTASQISLITPKELPIKGISIKIHFKKLLETATKINSHIFQRRHAGQAHVESTRNVRSSTVSPPAHAFHLTPVHLFPDVDMNASRTTNVVHTNTATTGSASKHVLNAERAQHATESLTIVLNANVQRVTLDQHSESAGQNATEMLTAQVLDQLASMVFVRIHVTVLAVLMLIATFVD